LDQEYGVPIVDRQLVVHDEETATRQCACDCKHLG